jgi:Fe-S cluster assembly ATPase SufC
MLYKFKSKNAGDVIMLEANGRTLLEVIGKDDGPTGIILAAQMPAAIDALQAAIALEESTQQALDAEGEPVKGDAPGLRQRAMPFIDMLKRNHTAGTDVVWGV